MKKKGLIISTVVMVVVLIASLTTATYAWFTTASSTTITGFDLTVNASTAINIGLKKECTYAANATTDSFVSGSCKYTGTAGQLGGGWDGDVKNMSPTIEHNINWGTVTKAVGVSSADALASATIGNTKTFTEQPNGGLMVAANLGNKAGADFGEKTDAVANGYGVAGEDQATADYAYLFLGVSPSKTLKANTNKAYVIVQTSGNGSTVGLSSAIHVAYRLNGKNKEQDATTWTDVDVYGDVHHGAQRASQKAEIPFDATVLKNSLDSVGTYTQDKTVIPNAKFLAIDLPATEVGVIDQLELVIYLAGSDSDCVDAAKGVTVKVAIFFSAQADQA